MTQRQALDPAKTVIKKCGGPGIVAKIVGLSRTQVWRWTQSKEHGGTGGLVPSEHQPIILAWARENDKPVNETTFFLQELEREKCA